MTERDKMLEKRRENQRAYYAANRDKVRERQRAYQGKNPHKIRAKNLRRKFGLTPEDYATMLEAQEFRCAICGVLDVCAPGNGPLHVDHDHATDKVRGLLCSECNTALGGFKDSPELLRSAAEYLEHYNPERNEHE